TKRIFYLSAITHKNVPSLLFSQQCCTYAAFCSAEHNESFLYFVVHSLSQFQSHDAYDHQNDLYKPEPGYNLTFMIAQLLIMMMQWRHEKYSSSFSVFFLRAFEVGYLDHHGKIFYQKNAADDR